MSVLPIVGRELVVAARQPGTYWLRFWTVLAMLSLWLVVLLGSGSVAPAEMGRHLLLALGFVALVFCLFAGAFQTADCLAGEKREGTMGLLFLTELKAHDVVLGKLAACSLRLFLALLAILPILGLSLLLGGVTGGEFARFALVFLVTLFFSMGLGMFASAVTRETRHAMIMSILLVLGFAAVFPILFLLRSLMLRHDASQWWMLPSPVLAYSAAFDVTYRAGGGRLLFWWGTGCTAGLGFLGIALATAILPRSWREREAARPARPRSAASARRERARRMRRRLLDINPYYWLERCDDRLSRWANWILLPGAAGCLALLICAMPSSHADDYLDVLIYCVYGLHVLFKLFVAVDASRRLFHDRRSGALELLLATPLPVRAILSGQLRALRGKYRLAGTALVLVNASLLVTVCTDSLFHLDLRDKVLFASVLLGGSALVFLDFHALAWIGMWRGLRAAKQHRAVLTNIGWVLGISWLGMFLVYFLDLGDESPNGAQRVVTAWLSLCGVVDLIGLIVARRKLRKRFRELAAGDNRPTRFAAIRQS